MSESLLVETQVPGLYFDTDTENVFLFDVVKYLTSKGLSTTEELQAFAFDSFRDTLAKQDKVVILIGDQPTK